MRAKSTVRFLVGVLIVSGCGTPDREDFIGSESPIDDDAGMGGGSTGVTTGASTGLTTGTSGGTTAGTSTGGVNTGGSTGGTTGGTTGATTGGTTGATTGGTTGGTTGATTGGTSGGGEVPMTDYCNPVAAWDPEWTQFEDEVLRLTNEARAVGHNCDAQGDKPPTTPLTLDPRLRCSARVHSKYMAEVGNDFAHTTMGGVTPGNRMQMAGYSGGGGENIAVGQRTPADVVAGWLDSDGHCANIMNARYKVIGIGYAFGIWENGGRTNDAPYWTQNFGSQ
jgi:uncharacterized protein YkwD